MSKKTKMYFLAALGAFLILIICSVVYGLFFSKKNIIISTDVVSEIKTDGQNIFFATLKNNTLAVHRKNKNEQELLFEQEGVVDIKNFSISENNRGAVNVTLQTQDYNPQNNTGRIATEQFIIVFDKRKELYKKRITVSDVEFLNNHELITFSPDTDFTVADGFFLRINLITAEEEKTSYSSESIKFLKKNDKLLFQEMSAHEDGRIDKIYEINKANNQVSLYLESTGLVSYYPAFGEAAFLTKNDEYRDSVYLLSGKNERLLEENNHAYRFWMEDGTVIGFSKKNDEDASKTDILKQYLPKEKIIIEDKKVMQSCYQPIIASNKLYYVCNGALMKLRGY